ncbi:hypothetical protein D3C80_1219060 [compost metagenome]
MLYFNVLNCSNPHPAFLKEICECGKTAYRSIIIESFNRFPFKKNPFDSKLLITIQQLCNGLLVVYQRINKTGHNIKALLMQQFQIERVRLQWLEGSILQRSLNDKPLLSAEAPVLCCDIKTIESFLYDRREHRTILRARKEDVCIVLILRNHRVGQICNVSRTP